MEGLGLVMVEAMGCGCPVVASDLPAVRDVISHNENGYLVKPGNISVLTASIHTMLEQPDLRTQLIQNGLQTAQQHFDWRAITQRYQTLILRSFHIPIKMEAASA